MEKTYKSVIVIALMLLPIISTAAISMQSLINPTASEASFKVTLNHFTSLSKTALIEKLGRKLTFKEKIGFFVMRNSLRKAIKQSPELGLMSVNDYFEGCSKIVLKNGDVIEADISQITPTEVRYKRCGKPNDPDIILNKRDVLSIKAVDGEILFRNTNQTYTNNSDNSEKKLEPNAAWGLVCALLLFPPAGIVLGIISLNRIKKNPEKYRGEGLAWASIILGVLMTILLIPLLSAG
jgi:Domain of unknown function (DUF4190)